MTRLLSPFIGGITGGLVVAALAYWQHRSGAADDASTEAAAQPQAAVVTTSPAKTSTPKVRLVAVPTTIQGQSLEPSECARRIDEDPSLGPQIPKWSFPNIDPQVLIWTARSGGPIPVVARGDFDGDSIADVAFLILTRREGADSGSEPDFKRVGVCISSKPSTVIYINDLYCSDGIGTTPKGAEYYDYEKDITGHYERDGIGTYCWEKAGATYLYDNASFTRVVDSD